MTEFSDIEARMKVLKAEIDAITELVGMMRKRNALALVKREEQRLIKAQSAAKNLNLPIAVMNAGRCKHQQQPYSMIKPKPRNAGNAQQKPA